MEYISIAEDLVWLLSAGGDARVAGVGVSRWLSPRGQLRDPGALTALHAAVFPQP